MGAHFISTCIGNAGLLFQELGEYDSAMAYLLECLAIRTAGDDTVHIAYTHYDIAELHNELGEFEKAVYHHEKALNLRKQIPNVVDDYNVIEDSYRALAMAYHRDGDNVKARSLLGQSLEINLRKGDVKRHSNTLRNLGEVAISESKFTEALTYLNERYTLDSSIHNMENSAELYTLIGTTYLKLRKYDLAELWLIRSRDLSRQRNLGPDLVAAYEALAEVYSSSNRFSEAVDYLKRAQNKKDSLLNEKKIKALKEMDVRYQTSIKEAKIAELNTQNELAQAEAKLIATEANRTRWILFGVLIILALTVGLVVIVQLGRKKMERTNLVLKQQKLDIEEKSELISKSLTEKEALLKEIHHRVKNNLQIISSLLNLQSASLKDSSALDAIKEGQHRVKSIALIHQKLHQTEDLSQVDFQEYCEQLVSFLQSAFAQKGKDIQTTVKANRIQLDIDTAVPLGLIINELVTNAYKYAFSDQDIGVIEIVLSRMDEGLSLDVRDNGKGMPEDFDLTKAKSLGMKLVQILSRQLKGKVNWANSGGAHFIIEFKESAARKISA